MGFEGESFVTEGRVEPPGLFSKDSSQSERSGSRVRTSRGIERSPSTHPASSYHLRGRLGIRLHGRGGLFSDHPFKQQAGFPHVMKYPSKPGAVVPLSEVVQILVGTSKLPVSAFQLFLTHSRNEDDFDKKRPDKL